MSTRRLPWVLRLVANAPRPPAKPRANQTPSPTRGIDVESFAPVAPPFSGAALWAELHTRALAYGGNDDSAWLATFAHRLPCSTCRPHWLEMVQRTPPDFSEGYFAWTVARHNEVNARLGKRHVPIEEARELWGTK